MTSSQHNLLYKIAALQLFDGSFNLDSNLATNLGLQLTPITQEYQKNNWNAKAWATTLALAFFIKKLETLKEDWELIADKSKIWLLENYGTQMDQMYELASTKYII